MYFTLFELSLFKGVRLMNLFFLFLFLLASFHGLVEIIFSKKRQKICEWVVETSYPHIEELYSKGLDTWPLISSLFFLSASYHGLVEIFSGLTLFICFSVACSLRATKTVYVVCSVCFPYGCELFCWRWWLRWNYISSWF